MNLLFNLAASNSGLLSAALFVMLVMTRVHWAGTIRSPMLFRWACTFFLLSVVTPPFLMLVMGLIGAGVFSPGRGGAANFSIDYILMICVGPTCLALSIFFLFGSIAPPVAHESKPKITTPPQKHPLD